MSATGLGGQPGDGPDRGGHARDPQDRDGLARAGTRWIGGLARTALALLRGVEVAAGALGLTALTLTVVAVSPGVRLAVVVVCTPLAAVPFVVAWVVHGRIAAIVRGVPRLTDDLRRVLTDPAVRRELGDAVADGRHSPVRHVWRLRRTVLSSRGEALDLWVSLIGLSRVPFALVVVGIGCVLLGIWCLGAVAVLLV